MNNNYWKDFYKDKKADKTPSYFAHYVQSYILHGDRFVLVDLGSGNGRDSVFFAEHGHSVISIDRNCIPYKGCQNLLHLNIDIDSFISVLNKKSFVPPFIRQPIVIYSRFFIHAIHKKQTVNLLNAVNSGMYFVAELRIKGDKPKIYKEHKRTLWDFKDFISMFDPDKWSIDDLMTGHGMAIYKDEDPLVMRIVARRL